MNNIKHLVTAHAELNDHTFFRIAGDVLAALEYNPQNQQQRRIFDRLEQKEIVRMGEFVKAFPAVTDMKVVNISKKQTTHPFIFEMGSHNVEFSSSRMAKVFKQCLT